MASFNEERAPSRVFGRRDVVAIVEIRDTRKAQQTDWGEGPNPMSGHFDTMSPMGTSP